MAEAVDRLELIADEEPLVVAWSAGEQIDQLALQPVRVLELVDHDRTEAQLLSFADRRVVTQEVARAQLQILEVERRLAVLPLLVGGSEADEQLLEQITVGRCELVQRSLLHQAARLFVRCGPLAAQLQIAEVEETVRGRIRLEVGERLTRRLALCLTGPSVLREAASRFAELVHPVGEARLLAELQDELAPGRPERLVDAREHPPQSVGSVHGKQPEPSRVVVGAEGRQGRGECFSAQDSSLALVEHTKARVDAGRERMGAKQPMTEAVDGRDPRAVELARQIGTSALDQARADPAAQLARRLLGVRDHEDRLDVDSLVAHGAREALDEHLRLARARARGHEHEPARLDSRLLFRVEIHARLIRHIEKSSHHVGQSPPFGSCCTSPVRMRSTIPTANSRAPSTLPQNSSSAR